MKLQLLVLVILLISCKKEVKINLENTTVQDSLIVKKEDIAKLNVVDFAIDKKAKPVLENWDKYQELKLIINDLKLADYTYFIGNNDNFSALIKDLTITLPEAIKTEPILSRILVLSTKLNKLESHVNQNNANKSETLSITEEVLVAFSNFKYQINKKYEKESLNVEKPFLNEN
ncbi:hypothetical protein [Lacinutrix salivirga]